MCFLVKPCHNVVEVRVFLTPDVETTRIAELMQIQQDSQSHCHFTIPGEIHHTIVNHCFFHQFCKTSDDSYGLMGIICTEQQPLASKATANTPCPEKRCHYIFSLKLCQILTDFQNYFINNLSSKFVKSDNKTPPSHLKHVATLPGEMFVLENRITAKSVGKRILKIGKYLAQLKAEIKRHLFFPDTL